MQFLLQATLLTRFFDSQNTQKNSHDDVFHEFTKTLMSLVATPATTVRIRTLSRL